MTARTGRGPTDPERRDRIAEAALRIAYERGIGAITHRAVAEAAGVPLGSTTYHFRDLDDLLVAAADRGVEEYRQDLRRRADAARRDGTDIADVVCEWVEFSLGADRHRTEIGYDLYFAALRRPALIRPARAWVLAARGELERHVSPRAARALTALLDGVVVQALVSGEVMAEDELRSLVRAVVASPD